MTTVTLYTIEEVARRFNITRRALDYRIAKRGSFGARKIGRRILFDESVFTSPLSIPG